MWGYGNYGSMMNWGGGFTFFWVLYAAITVVLLIDLILLGIWLWKQINRK